MNEATSRLTCAEPLGDRTGIDFKTDPMVLSQDALDVLFQYIAPYGEVLPLDFDEAKYSLFNVTHVIEALDLENSEMTFFSSGKPKMIKRYAFAQEEVSNAWIFKIPQQLGNFCFVTDRFVEVASEAGLTGFAFELLWTSKTDNADD